MPVNNDFLGIYKSVKISGKRIIASDLSRNRNMEVAAQNFLLGTQKAKVLNIGGVSEDITINSPLLVGVGSSVDGRALANLKLNEILNPQTAVLPILKSFSYNIDSNGAKANLSLESDGDPNNTTVFEVRSDEITELNPVLGKTRFAQFYDFRVRIGRRECFILSGSLTVSIANEKKYFLIPGYWSDYRGWGDPLLAGLAITNTAIGATNITIAGNGATYQPGTQFPFLGVGGITVNGKGSAAVFLENLTDEGGTGSSTFLDDGEATNLSLKPGTSDMTLQDPGVVRYENVNLALDIYDQAYYDLYPAGLGWTSLLLPGLDLSKSVVHTSNYNLNPGMMTVDFDFTSWIG